MVSKRPIRRGFTLAEVIVAGVITAFIIAAVSTTVGQLGRAKASSRQRLTAFLRADAALNAIRVDIATVTRDTDLFYARFMIKDEVAASPYGDVDRDDILLFNTRLRAVRDLSYQGEGLEYETQYRIEDDELGSVLWQRRDSVPDEFTLGGGQAFPFVEGIIAMSIEAYDGTEWRERWDSDKDGLPLAVRVEITATGENDNNDTPLARLATLRTVIAIDRVAPPKDWLLPTPEEELELDEFLNELLATLAAPSGQNPQDGGGAGVPIDRDLFEGGGAVIDVSNLTPEQRARIRSGGGGPGDNGGFDNGGGGPGGVGGGGGGNRPGGAGGGGNPNGPNSTGGRNPNTVGGGGGNSGGGGGGGSGSLGGGAPPE